MLYAGIIAVLRSVDGSWAHYDSVGLTLLAYSVSRALFAIYIGLICTVLGALFFKRVFRQAIQKAAKSIMKKGAWDRFAHLLLIGFASVSGALLVVSRGLIFFKQPFERNLGIAAYFHVFCADGGLYCFYHRPDASKK